MAINDLEFSCEEVASVFNMYPEPYKSKLLKLRELIFDVASQLGDEVGPVTEALRWGEPSYLTMQSKSGSTIRLAWHASKPNQYGMFLNCKTTLIADIKEIYGPIFNYGGNRSILFTENDVIPIPELSDCIAMALTYHLNKIGVSHFVRNLKSDGDS